MFRDSRLLLAGILSLLFTFFATVADAAPDGKALFQANCATCHNPLKDATGPALQGVNANWPSPDWVHDWVHNPSEMIAKGDKHANEVFAKYKPTVMTAFPQLKTEEIDAIIKYVNEYKAPGSSAGPGGAAATTTSTDDNAWIYTLATFGMLMLAVILWRVNAGLKRVAAEKVGGPVDREVPLYRSKFVIAIVSIVLTICAGYWIVNGAIEMGRQQNYEPTQPIYYSHKVHAGINQINCLYCHAGAEKSRQAMIPSSNICMNCHKQISEYTGEKDHPLHDDQGREINGTLQIAELYKYAGWDPEKKEYRRDAQGKILATPIKWTKIHNLPDHVYFNHSQHVKVGQVQCQRCHGNIEEMDEVYQFAPLSMGWCINCHRQTQVKFQDNNYYSLFEKYHNEIKAGKRDGVTVEDIGGLECQKCHY
jgi:mono/diheme cytochrome c family protein